MSHALDPSAYIHLGLWINQSKGSFLGLTLTVSPTNATLLTNLMAVFVTMAGGQFWTILRFSLHQVRALSTNRDQNLLHNQQQVILRNTTSATATAQSLVCLGWASRRNNVIPFRKSWSVSIILLAILTAVFFIIAGAFSNTVTDAGPYVLSRSPFCGFFNQTYLDLAAEGIAPVTAKVEAMMAEYTSWSIQDVERSLQYSQDCYLTEGTGSSNCDILMKSTLPTATLNNGTCAFHPRMCLPGVDTVVFDTGPIDTHNDLGINAAPEDRLTYRRVNNCTVLNSEPYITDWLNQSSTLLTQPTWRIANASYGYSLYRDTNETYSYSNFADFYTTFASEYSLSYTLGSDRAFGVSNDPGGSTFVPIPEIEQTDADLYLFHLSYTGNYLEPVDDPWFAAHQPFVFSTSAGNTVVTYTRDKPITTVGCTEQHQLCNTHTCTPLLGFEQVQDHITAHLSLTPKQNVTYNQLSWNIACSGLDQIASSLALGSTPLLATQKRQNGRHTTSVPLPDYQWKLELANWESITRAHLQRLTAESQTGQIAAQPEYLLAPATESEKWLCQNLMIRSSTYQSFSVLALSILVSVGTLVILLSLTIESISAWLFRSIGRGETGNDIWRAHDMLDPQLWSRKLEAIKAGGAQSPNVRKDSIASWETSTSFVDEKEWKRVSSQALSFEDRERLLIAQAYESWL